MKHLLLQLTDHDFKLKNASLHFEHGRWNCACTLNHRGAVENAAIDS